MFYFAFCYVFKDRCVFISESEDLIVRKNQRCVAVPCCDEINFSFESVVDSIFVRERFYRSALEPSAAVAAAGVDFVRLFIMSNCVEVSVVEIPS